MTDREITVLLCGILIGIGIARLAFALGRAHRRMQ